MSTCVFAVPELHAMLISLVCMISRLVAVSQVLKLFDKMSHGLYLKRSDGQEPPA